MPRRKEFIDGDKNKGLNYDWVKIKKMYRKLGCPSETFDPTVMPLGSVAWMVLASARSIGKTTNVLLTCLCAHVWSNYRSMTVYVRQLDDSVTKGATQQLFDTILAFDYISKATDGKYNNIVYFSKRWYLAKTDDTGKVVEQCETPFVYMTSIQSSVKLKSVFSNPYADFCIFDEFINDKGYYIDNEFILLCNLLSTVFRDRLSCTIFLLANGLDPYHQYFSELGIAERMATISLGDSFITEGDESKIYVNYIDFNDKKRQIRNATVDRYYKFKNPLLSSISGTTTWALKNYPHFPSHEDKVEVLVRNIYINYQERWLNLRIVLHDELGLCLYVNWAGKEFGRYFEPYKDSIILTLESGITDSRRRRFFGSDKLEKLINRLMLEGRCFFQSNDVGKLFETYYTAANKVSLL